MSRLKRPNLAAPQQQAPETVSTDEMTIVNAMIGSASRAVICDSPWSLLSGHPDHGGISDYL
jgi:hypothetical protein